MRTAPSSPARAGSPAEAAARDGAGRFGRRVFLGTIGIGISSLWWGDDALDVVRRAAAPVTPDGLEAALPSPSEGWRIYSVNPPMPRFDPRTWRLRIDGLVEQPMELSYDALRELPAAAQTSDFHCVTGWKVPDVRWDGVRIDQLLAAVRPRPEAGALTFTSAERPYVDSLTLEQATRPDALLAYAMDDEPLTQAHGAPVRMVMPAMYGYKGVKWVERITLTRRPARGYWERRGYDKNAWVGRSNGYG